MSVEVRTVRDPELRVQVVDQRTAFDSDPDGFNAAMDDNQKALQRGGGSSATAGAGGDR